MADALITGQTRIAGREMPIRRFVGIPPNRDASGEIEQMGLLAGQGVGLVTKSLPTADLVRKVADEARIVIAQRLGQPRG
jgi:NAD(P)H-dependent flavin oxidoreductase YrpB (nitropropane dioxygenase family)